MLKIIARQRKIIVAVYINRIVSRMWFELSGSTKIFLKREEKLVGLSVVTRII